MESHRQSPCPLSEVPAEPECKVAPDHSHPLPTSHLTPPPLSLSSPPILLLLAGSLSPVTHMHLRLLAPHTTPPCSPLPCLLPPLELARDHFTRHGRHVLGGFISPVADAYNKPDLVPANHRLEMVSLALSDSNWIALDRWEADHGRFVRTYKVMRRMRGSAKACGLGDVEVYLVMGGDMLESMGDENRWPKDSIQNLFQEGHVAWVGRDGKGSAVLSKGGRLHKWIEKCVKVEGWVSSLSSTLVR
eukprot:GFKZ01011601.1.p1 GENE.GFKZ01011601.1~~GFKZ01011601.1.p1  ORF type:complete len:246 (+),score=13.27 GFKZ01011601.1:104-841(+)